MPDEIDAVDAYVGAQIRLRRKELKISQGRLGEVCGVTFQQLQKYERGTNRVSASMLYKIAGELACAPGDLFPSRKEGDPSAAADLSRAVALVPGLVRISELSPRGRKAIAAVIAALLSDEG